MLGSDTAKRDITLAVMGLLAASFFYFFYSSVHPLSSADSSVGKETASGLVVEKLTSLGFVPGTEAVTSFKVDRDVLNVIQKRSAENVTNNSAEDTLAQFSPPFYWLTDQKITIDERTAVLMGTEPGEERVEVKLSEEGELLSLRNPGAVFPSRVLNEGFYTEYDTTIVPFFQQLRADPEILDKFYFQLNDNRINYGFEPDERRFVLSGEDLRNLAGYHLEKTAWRDLQFTIDDIETVVYHGVDLARVHFIDSGSETTRLQFDILPTGALIALGYTYEGDEEVASAWSDVHLGILVVATLLFAIWILVLLFLRIRLRLIDIKLSVLVAVLAGFLLPVQFLFEWIYQFFYTFEDFALREVFQRLFFLGIVAAAGSIVYFTTTAVGDSVTRDNWSEKLRTFDLVRIGKIYNRPVGMAFLNAVIYSYILAALFVFLIYITPGSFISVPETFRSDRTILPSVVVLISNGLLFLIVVQTVLLIAVGKLSSYTKNGFWIVLFTASILALIGFLPLSVGPFSANVFIGGAVGLGIGWIYFKEDFLTIFFSLFLLGVHLFSAPGWVMNLSPDSSLFYSSLLLTVIMIGIGLFGLYKGQPIDQLPEYVPEYINDLKKDERIKQELQIARTVQRSFLPGRMPVGNGFEYAAICKPALETGGDYYDFIKMDDNQLAVTIGDVSGKGIEAAFYMTFTKGVLHALCHDNISAADILAKINTLFLKNARKGTFISLIFGVIDHKESSFRFARGGHNPLLYFSAEKGTIEEFRPSGIGLGMAGDDLFRENIAETVIHLKKGDLIVLFTDGVVEAINSRGHFYGDKRLHGIIKRYSKLSADKIIKAITNDLQEFGEGSEPHDDMTAIVIKKQ